MQYLVGRKRLGLADNLEDMPVARAVTVWILEPQERLVTLMEFIPFSPNLSNPLVVMSSTKPPASRRLGAPWKCAGGLIGRLNGYLFFFHGTSSAPEDVIDKQWTGVNDCGHWLFH
jgi:hypothetical protein